MDCNDADVAVNPSAAENCTDGVDNDCDGLIDDADPDAVGCPQSVPMLTAMVSPLKAVPVARLIVTTLTQPSTLLLPRYVMTV